MFRSVFVLLLMLVSAISFAQHYELNIAHINDSHSNIRSPDTQELFIDGEIVYAPLGGFSRLVTLFKSLEGKSNVLKLHAGDAITGTYFYKLFDGKVDAIAMNNVCFDAFIPGNHEFDFGDEKLKLFLDYLRDQSSTCKTPVLAANIHPGMVPPPASPLINRADGAPYFLPHVIKTIGGVRVGIIGINVVGKTKNASKPNPSTIFEDEAIAAQRSIDELKSQGVKHIILMTHIGYENDVVLAQKLTDVDIIIGGDSHTFLGNYSPVVKKTPAGNYPTIVKNKSGDIVCIGQAWEYTKVFAQMNVKFNDNGSVKSCSGSSAVVVGDVFFSDRDLKVPFPEHKNVQIQAKLKNVIDVRISAEDLEFNRQISPYNAAYDQDAQIQIGTQQGDQSLCLIRVPGSKNRGGPICDSVANLASGSDITQVVTEGYRKAAEQSSDPFVADFALTNAGGIRKELETDGVKDRILKMEDIFAIQPFPNELIMIQITGSEMKLALEQGVQNWADHGNSDGSHPYASGLRWHLDLAKEFGARFSNIEVKDHGTGSWSALDPSAKYKLIVTDYLRDGAENYLIFRDICVSPNSNRCLPLGGIYATDSFAEYIKKLTPKKVARPKCEEYSHQNVIKRDGTRLTHCQ